MGKDLFPSTQYHSFQPLKRQLPFFSSFSPRLLFIHPDKQPSFRKSPTKHPHQTYPQDQINKNKQCNHAHKKFKSEKLVEHDLKFIKLIREECYSRKFRILNAQFQWLYRIFMIEHFKIDEWHYSRLL